MSADLLAALADDLRAENAAFDAALEAVALDAPTPAERWTVRDAVAHLHLSDLAGLAAVAGEDVGGRLKDIAVAAYGSPDLLGDWRTARSALIDAVLARPAAAGRIPWFGPPMSPASFLTARLMETWAHGIDVRDAAGLPTTFAPRLRHIADLGVRTRGWSYAVRGLTPPTAEVSVTLSTPDGGTWSWGSPAAQSVSGTALDFCLLVVQRRPLATLDLVARGSEAAEWLGIAQAFAGRASDNRT